MEGSLPFGAELRVRSWLPPRVSAPALAAESAPAADVRRRPAGDTLRDPDAKRVTIAFLRLIYDALPEARRRAIFLPGVTWSARGIRVESSPVVVGSALHRDLARAVAKHATQVYIETPDDARRCVWCGCTDQFACAGSCSWVQADRCSACRDRREPEPTHQLAPGALTPGALDTAATKRRGRP